MARKSRLYTDVEEKQVKTSKEKVAVYARLSHEREDTIERDTIGTQVTYIMDYLAKHEEMQLYDTYVDDSVSGTTFARPSFDRLVSDMKKGKFDTVIVKDLSRLGRDYLEAGNFIERIFPLYHIRFIAINDGFDSGSDDVNLTIPVTNIANALYAQDISKKVISSKEQSMKRGIPTSNVHYGYKLVKINGKPSMVIDDEAAEVVKRIFAMYLSGMGKFEIYRKLNDEGVPTPYQYKMRNHPEKLKDKPGLHWKAYMIDRILDNEVYIGKYTCHKTERKLYKHEAVKKVAPDNWYVFEEHHPAIISKEDFDKAKNLKKPAINTKCKKENLRMFASAYILKPVAEDEIREVFSHLRYPVPKKNKGLYVQCIGTFEVFFDGKPVQFHRSKTKELFAYLVDKRGASATNAELRAALWEDEVDDSTQKRNYFIQCVRELKMTLERLGYGEVFLHSRNFYALDMESFCCDIDSYLDSGKNIQEIVCQGYMEQYGWARTRG